MDEVAGNSKLYKIKCNEINLLTVTIPLKKFR